MDALKDLIYPVIDEISPTLENGGQLKKSPQTVLFGSGAALDSLGLVNFIVAVEDRIEERMNKSVTLANAKALSRENSPFRTIGSLAEYVEDVLKET